MRLSDRGLGILLVTGSAVAWSTAGLFTRVLAMDAATMLVWRGLFGACGLLAVLLLREGRRGLGGFRRLGAAGWLYAGLSAGGMLCFITGLTLTSVAHVAVIYAVAPFLAAGLGWALLGEAPGRAGLIAAAAALAGAAVMVGLSSDGGLLGDLLALGMTTAMALMMVIARARPGIPTLPAATVSTLLSSLAVLPFASLALPGPEDALLLAGFGLVNSALGLGLFLMGSARLPPVQSALIGALDAPLAPLWVWLVFAETPGAATLTGGALVMAAVIWHTALTARKRG
jgi:drug/metabolite transporter (DMT)-like permease